MAALPFSVLVVVLFLSLLSVADEVSTSTDRPEKNVAVATLVTTSAYVAGAEVLAKSLDNEDAIGDRILFYVLPEDDPRSDLTEEHLTDLREAKWQTRRLSKENATYSECIASAAEQPVVDATPTSKSITR